MDVLNTKKVQRTLRFGKLFLTGLQHRSQVSFDATELLGFDQSLVGSSEIFELELAETR